MKHLLFILLFTMLRLSVFGQESEVYIPFRVGEKWSVANESGEMLFEPKFEETFPSAVDRIRFKECMRYGFINPDGIVVIEPTYKEATDFEKFGGKTFSSVTVQDSSFYINTNGDIVTPNYGCSGVFHNFANGLSIFEMGGKYGLIALGRDTVVPPIFKHIKNYNDGELVVAQNFDEKYGVISSKGDTIYGFTLDSVQYKQANFGIQYYEVFETQKVGVIDVGGKIQAYPKYDNLIPYSTGRLFCYMAIIDETKMGYVYKGIEFWK